MSPTPAEPRRALAAHQTPPHAPSDTAASAAPSQAAGEPSSRALLVLELVSGAPHTVTYALMQPRDILAAAASKAAAAVAAAAVLAAASAAAAGNDPPAPPTPPPKLAPLMLRDLRALEHVASESSGTVEWAQPLLLARAGAVLFSLPPLRGLVLHGLLLAMPPPLGVDAHTLALLQQLSAELATTTLPAVTVLPAVTGGEALSPEAAATVHALSPGVRSAIHAAAVRARTATASELGPRALAAVLASATCHSRARLELACAASKRVAADLQAGQRFAWDLYSELRACKKALQAAMADADAAALGASVADTDVLLAACSSGVGAAAASASTLLDEQLAATASALAEGVAVAAVQLDALRAGEAALFISLDSNRNRLMLFELSVLVMTMCLSGVNLACAYTAVNLPLPSLIEYDFGTWLEVIVISTGLGLALAAYIICKLHALPQRSAGSFSASL